MLDFFTALLKGYLIVIAIWLVTIIIVAITLFKRKDILLPVKIFWAVIIFAAPLLGLILYLVIGLPKRKKLLDVDKPVYRTGGQKI